MPQRMSAEILNVAVQDIVPVTCHDDNKEGMRIILLIVWTIEVQCDSH
jgi:hypothetical protein